jgi:OmcA/MtrC family decaheme c-type cytochrome
MSCSVHDNGDGSSTITCEDGTSATVANGQAGQAGQDGQDGTSCTVTDNGNGTATIACTNGSSATVANGQNGQDGASCLVVNNGNGTRTITCGNGSSVTVADAVVDYSVMTTTEKAESNMAAVVTDVSVPADGRPVVTLKVSDRKGNGVKNLGATVASWRFALLKLVAGVNGSANETWVSYLAANDHSSAGTETATAAGLIDNADGTYTYRFTKVITNAAAAGTTYDASAVHRLVVLLYASGNPFAPINVVKEFVPATGADVTNQNEKATGAACLECHTRFRAPAGGTGAFHSGQRYDLRACAACHNDQRRFSSTGTNVAEVAVQADGTWTGNASVVNGEAFINLPVFIHKIHMGEDLTLTGGTYPGVARPYEVTYPQDVRNCAKCHRDVAKASNWKDQPSRRACGACHDNISFVNPAPAGRRLHSGGARLDDSLCATCHDDASFAPVSKAHVTVALPDPNSTYAGGTNANTNAASVAAAGVVPEGATKITYLVSSVSRDATQHPVIVFKLQKQGPTDAAPVDVAFNPNTSAELIDGFVGSPSVYFAFAVPQDGIDAPADFNATASGYIKAVWKGTVTGATMTGPDATGFYTITLGAVTIPDTATMLTGGLGYTYALASTQPLTQIDLPAYPYAANKTGGLIVPAPNIWKPATGYAPRRAIVANAKCNACHAALGAAPTFHAGQRNDAPTCSFCHVPNRASSGWSANAKDFVHGIHGAGVRTNAFTWHAISLGQGLGKGFWEVTYPGVLNNCESCHVAGTYDYSASASSAVVKNLLASTVAAGTYSAPAAGLFNTVSPFVALGTDYGTNFTFTAATGAYVDAVGTTRIVTPITAACVACHDGALAIDHMESNGGAFYKARAEALVKNSLGKAVPTEQCLLCHGKGKVAAIEDVHR